MATPSSALSTGSSAVSSASATTITAAQAVAAIIDVLPALPATMDASQATIDNILNVVHKLNYNQRLEWAGRFGAKFKEHKELPGVIAKLRDHPAPKLPQIKADEDKAAAELLPPQRKNIVCS
jgi:hypothetical protein